MPYTLNGIGTHYYGKKNLQTRNGVCQYCQKETLLESYETRLWGVVLFIPLLPLGRKQIINYCPLCTRHQVMSAKEWAETSRTIVKGVEEKLTTAPDDPETMIQAHAELNAIGKIEEAGVLAENIRAKFAANCEVQLYLADWYRNHGHAKEAKTCLKQALAADPKNPHARCGVAVCCIQENQLDQAEELLACMNEKGPHQNPGPLLLLAQAQQQAQQPKKALETCQRTALLFPELAEKDKTFRKQVKEIEQDLGRPNSMLPKRPLLSRIWVKNAVITVVVVTAAMTLFFFINQYQRGHQHLYLLNRTGIHTTVAIDGVQVPVDNGVKDYVLAEGAHHAVITFADKRPEQTLDFSLGDGFWARYFDHPCSILNIGSAAVLLWEETVYSANPQKGKNGKIKLNVGNPFICYRNIDFPFQAFPKTISIEGSSVTKHRVSALRFPIKQIIFILQDRGVPPANQLTFLEAHLPQSPNEPLLLVFYASIGIKSGNATRCLQFLRRGIQTRLQDVEWHRMYQTLCLMSGEQAKLIAEYNNLLKKNPKNAKLLYLRGRLEPEITPAIKYFDQAIALDPKFSRALLAKAWQLGARGDFATAEKISSQALLLPNPPIAATSYLWTLRYALGKYKILAQQARKNLGKNPCSLEQEKDFLAALMAQNKGTQAATAILNFKTAVEKKIPADPYALKSRAQIALAYLQNDAPRMVDALKQIKNDAIRAPLALQHKIEYAPQTIPPPGDLSKQLVAYDYLLISIAQNLDGNKKAAQTWWEAALVAFRNSQELIPCRQEILTILKKIDHNTISRVDRLGLSLENKRILYAAIKPFVPVEDRAKVAARLKLFNTSPYFPHHLLARVVKAQD